MITNNVTVFLTRENWQIIRNIRFLILKSTIFCVLLVINKERALKIRIGSKARAQPTGEKEAYKLTIRLECSPKSIELLVGEKIIPLWAGKFWFFKIRKDDNNCNKRRYWNLLKQLSCHVLIFLIFWSFSINLGKKLLQVSKSNQTWYGVSPWSITKNSWCSLPFKNVIFLYEFSYSYFI